MIFNYKFKNYSAKVELHRNIPKAIKSLTVFNYHQIGETFDPMIHTKGTFTSSDFFEEQVIYMKKNYHIISLSNGINMLNEGHLDGKYASISIDDGDKSCLSMMRILEKHNVPATFFINSSYIDNKHSYWYPIYNFIKNNKKYVHLLTDEIEENVKLLRHTKDKQLYKKYSNLIEKLFDEIKSDFKLYLSTDDLIKMNHSLFDIGIHGFRHERFSMMEENWQKVNLEQDIESLSRFSNYKSIFAIPFGRTQDWNHSTVKIALNMDLDLVFADGGINFGKEVGYKRIPADSRELSRFAP